VSLFWSARGGNDAVVYQLNREGERIQAYNVPLDGSLNVATRRSDRGQLDFLLVVTRGEFMVDQRLSIPLACPIPWFFMPGPVECPDADAVPSLVIEQSFERGRMIYLGSTDRVYALFNDAESPGWIDFPNLYDPAIHPESEESFPGLQPIARLGFVWRGNDTARRRLGSPIAPEVSFDGLVQTAQGNIYISSVGGTVVQLLPGGADWALIMLAAP